jgi:hypothetical protein
MKELYINDKLTLVIYDNDLQVGDDNDDFIAVSEYLETTIVSNMDYDAVSYNNKIEWRIK